MARFRMRPSPELDPKQWAQIDEAIDNGAQYIVLSDRDSNKDFAPVPSLLMLAARL